MADLVELLVFARYPVSGQAKTRLIPALGPDGAARLHRRMTEHAVAVARVGARAGSNAITICCTGARRRLFRAWLGSDLNYATQPHGDLGTRLRRAFASSFRHGATRALAVGSDVPDLSPELVRQATQALDDHDIALGPAEDGGYYLLGMKRVYPELFRGMDWGSERVGAHTREAILRLGLKLAELPTLSDVDIPENLDPLRDDERFADVFSGQPLLSVIIPSLNEAAVLSETLDRIHCAHGIEVIVVDGGSRDATREIATEAGAAVFQVNGGRAAQQNAGAAVAKGRHLLFLHADTLLPEGYVDMIRMALDSPSTVAGAFRFETDDSRAGMQLVAWGTNIRSFVFQWPYGDQGLFMEKRVFREVEGFAALTIMEDFDLVRRLRRRGRVSTLQASAITSSRRWRKLGAWRVTLLNQMMIAGFFAGVAPERLARFYRRKGR